MAMSMDRSVWVRAILYLIFCGVAALMVLRTASQSGGNTLTPLAEAGFAFFIALGTVVAVELNLETVTRRNGRVILLFGGVLAQLALMRVIMLFAEANGMPDDIVFLLTPFVLAPMVHAVLLGKAAGVFSTVQVALLGALMVPDAEGPRLIAVTLLTGMVVVQCVHLTRRRVQLLRAGLYAGLMALALALLLGVIDLSRLGGEVRIDDWKMVGSAALAALGTGIATALVVSGSLPVIEGMFQLTTNISWLEQSDLNHRLMRRLQLEAPGTFHHSLVVAALSEAAAEAVGANAAMCRVCAYFHDIGKLTKPEYFIENQIGGQENPHDALTPTMSSLIIIAHVKDGVDLALKHKLNPRIIDVIREHHGDSLVSYFHRRAREQKREEMEKVEKKLENPEDLPKIDEKNFRYPGPRPRSRESGIISLADAVESASRTIRKPTPAKIRALVDDIVEKRICDGQLDYCDLTLRDLSTVKGVFAKTLRSMLHSRIDYPKDEDKGPKSDLEERSGEGARKAARKAARKTAKTAKPETRPPDSDRRPPVAKPEKPDRTPPIEALRAAAWGR